MARWIDADALEKKLSDFVRPSNNSDFAKVPRWNDAVAIIESMPAADVVPVRHGRWEAEIITDVYGLKHDCYVCSVCGAANNDDYDEYDFCPNCGAKMDGGDPMEDDLK